jgi:hypothetical protein
MVKRAILTSLAVGAMLVPAAAATPPNGNGHKVTICHQTHSATNPVVVITVDRASFDLNPSLQGHYPPHHESGDEVFENGEGKGECVAPPKGGGNSKGGNSKGE